MFLPELSIVLVGGLHVWQALYHQFIRRHIVKSQATFRGQVTVTIVSRVTEVASCHDEIRIIPIDVLVDLLVKCHGNSNVSTP